MYRGLGTQYSASGQPLTNVSRPDLATVNGRIVAANPITAGRALPAPIAPGSPNYVAAPKTPAAISKTVPVDVTKLPGYVNPATYLQNVTKGGCPVISGSGVNAVCADPSGGNGTILCSAYRECDAITGASHFQYLLPSGIAPNVDITTVDPLSGKVVNYQGNPLNPAWTNPTPNLTAVMPGASATGYVAGSPSQIALPTSYVAPSAPVITPMQITGKTPAGYVATDPSQVTPATTTATQTASVGITNPITAPEWPFVSGAPYSSSYVGNSPTDSSLALPYNSVDPSAIATPAAASNWFTDQTIITGAPNWAILAGGGLAAWAVFKKKGR